MTKIAAFLEPFAGAKCVVRQNVFPLESEMEGKENRKEFSVSNDVVKPFCSTIFSWQDASRRAIDSIPPFLVCDPPKRMFMPESSLRAAINVCVAPVSSSFTFSLFSSGNCVSGNPHWCARFTITIAVNAMMEMRNIFCERF